MKFTLNTFEQRGEVSIEIVSPNYRPRASLYEAIEENIRFEKATCGHAEGLAGYPELSKFLSEATFHVALYTQHANRNPDREKAPIAQVYFRNSVLGKCVDIEAFLANELLVSAVHLSSGTNQKSFSVEIIDESVLDSLENSILEHVPESNSCCLARIDKFNIFFF